MSEHFTNPKNYSEYRLYCYSGGLLNTSLKWEENGCDCDAGEIAGLLKNFIVNKPLLPEWLKYFIIIY